MQGPALHPVRRSSQSRMILSDRIVTPPPPERLRSWQSTLNQREVNSIGRCLQGQTSPNTKRIGGSSSRITPFPNVLTFSVGLQKGVTSSFRKSDAAKLRGPGFHGKLPKRRYGVPPRGSTRQTGIAWQRHG